MKKVLFIILACSLCSCDLNNSDNANSETSKIEVYEESLSYIDDNDKKNEYLGKLEAELINDSAILPINSSNDYCITYALKSNNNPVIINGKNYYKIKDYVVLDDIVSTSLNTDINKYCYENNIDYLTYCSLNNIKTNESYTIPFNEGNITSLNFYDFNNYLQNNVLLQCHDSLLEVDIFGNVTFAMASNYYISDDKLTYTFTLKDNLFYVNNKGEKIDVVKAKDFVNGFKHMLDSSANNNMFNEVVNVDDYIKGFVNFDEVGIKDIDDKTLSITLINKDPDFINKIANNSIIAYNESNLFTGAYYLSYIGDDKIELDINPYYYKNNVSIKKISFIKDNYDLLTKFNNKEYSEIAYKENYSINSDLITKRYVDSSIRYALINTNRENFEVYSSDIKSNKTESEILITKNALNNINFKKAIMSCIDVSLFTDNNKLDTLSLYDAPIKVNDKTIIYSEYINSLIDDKIYFDLNKAKEYYQKYLQETNQQNKIILDVLCYSKDIKMKSNIESIKNIIEETLNKENVYVNIIYIDQLYYYFLAGHQKYKCYDLYFDFTVNVDYNSRYRYLYEIIKCVNNYE